jgi:hypothetical protein
MKNQETAEKFLSNLRTKFRALNQVYDLTKEMEGALSSADVESLDIVLDMRQKQIDVCVGIDEANEKLLDTLSPEERVHAEGLLKTRDEYSVPQSEDEEQILSMTKRIHTLLIKTIDYDNEISKRIKK